MITEEYLNRSRLFRCLRNGPHGSYVERYASQLVKVGLSRHGTWRSLNLVGDLMSWLTCIGSTPTGLNERMVEQYLRHRSKKQSIQPGDWAALRRLLSVLREAGAIAPAALPPLTPHEQIFEAFSHYLQEERGLAARSIVHHFPFIRLFLRGVCPGGASDLGRIGQADVTCYIERHARDRSAAAGKSMCWALRSFLRYLHHKALEFATIRLHLLKIAGRIFETASRIRIALTSCCPEAGTFSLVALKLQPPGP
jgi:hypothetical protein